MAIRKRAILDVSRHFSNISDFRNQRGDSNIFLDEYFLSRCIVAVAIALSTTTDISGFTPKSDNVQIGTEPCYCGFFFCAKCPIFSEQEARLPIYNHHKIPKEIEERLEEWMVRNAVQKVNKLFSA